MISTRFYENLNTLPSKTSNYKEEQHEHSEQIREHICIQQHFWSNLLFKHQEGNTNMKRRRFTNQHIAIFDVEVQEEEEGDEEAEEGDGGAFP